MEPTDIAHRVIDDNHFMVLGTSQPDGTPRVSPVFYNHAGYCDFYSPWRCDPATGRSSPRGRLNRS